jgi:hypothetical protein
MTYSTSGGITVNGVTQGYNTTLYTVDGALSNYSASNAVYLNGNRAGWLAMQADGTQNTYIQLFGSTNATPNYIGFYTGVAERMRIDASGNVGIGATNPTTKLQVVGTTLLSSASSYGASSAAVSIYNGGSSANYYKADNHYWQQSSGTNTMQVDSGGTFYINSGYGSVAAVYGCRAWVTFNGTGTPAVRSSGNVSSITDYGTGDYFVAFTTNLVDTNYSVAGGSVKGPGGPSGANSGIITMGEAPAVNGTGIAVLTIDGSAVDRAYVYAAFFR